MADAHVGAAPPATEAALLEFLERLPELGDGLLVAGDLFEFWFAWRRAIPRRAFPVAAALARLAARFPVYMIGGNHDRWGRPFWAEDAGIGWARSELRLDVGGLRVLALHGDGLAERGGKVGLVHRMVGHPATSALFGLLHPDLGLRIVDRVAPWLGDGAGNRAAMRAAAERQRTWARARADADGSFDILVMAHTHVPVLEPLTGARSYVNPGPWLEEHRYAVIGVDGTSLRQVSPSE